MKRTKLKSAFGWVGGKSKLAADIVEMIPNDHKIYIEVFGGALNILYAKEPSRLEVINDINGELINLHRIIRNNPQTLSMYLHQLFISREIFNDIKTKHMKPRNNIEKASFYYYLISQSFGSKCDSFAMNAKSGRKPNIYKSFMQWSKRLKHVTIENKSFENLIKIYDKNEAFFYCDPPYVGTESYYKNTGGFNIDEHIKLRDILSQIKGKFLISYNDCEIVRDLYKDFKISTSKEIEYTLGKNAHKKDKKVREIYITNY